jgi:hypothetical protein
MWSGPRARTIPVVSSSSLTHRAAAALAAGAACLALAAPPAHAAYGWFSGTSSYQQGPQCFGQSTGYGINTDASVSYWTNPQESYPAIGDRYLMRTLIGVVGFSCNGGISDMGTELLLPAGTALSIDLQSSDPTDKVRCWYEGSNGQVTEVTDKTWTHPGDPSIKGKWCDSTKIPAMGTYGYDTGYRLAPQGAMFWIDVPVISYTSLNGMAGAGNTTKMGAAVSSGVNTFVNPTQWVTVFDRPATVDYPADATTAVADTTAKTKAVLNAWYRKGTAYVDLGTGAAGEYQVSAGPIAIDGTWATYTITQDWGRLTPGTDHHWRLRFVDDQGATTTGAAKTFRTTGTAPSGGGGGGPAPTPTPGGGATGGGTPAGGSGGTPTGGGSGGTGGTGGGSGGTGGTGGAPTGGGSGPAGGGLSAPAPAPIPAGAAATPAPAPRGTLAPGTRLRALAGPAGARVTVPCAKACRATATLKVDAATARRLGLGRKAITLVTGRATTTKPGAVTITLKATGRVARALRRARSLTATLAVSLDGAPPRATKVTLRR